jgi:hypothetical protein
MRLPNLLCAASASLALASAAFAQETVKLEYKLKPGTELVYKGSGTVTLKQSAADNNTQNIEMTLSATERYIIADVDAATGVMLIGQFPKEKVTTKVSTPGNEKTQEQTIEAASVCRLDRLGSPVARKAKEESKSAAFAALIQPLGVSQLTGVPLPAEPVALGATWESTTDTGLPGIPLPFSCKVVSKLVEIQTVEGHKCAVIQSKFTPGKPEQKMLAVSGIEEDETTFDMDAGYFRGDKVKADLKINTFGQSISLAFECSSLVESVKALPAEEAARDSSVIKALDAAIASAYDGEFDKGIAALEAFKPADLPEDWKPGIIKDISTLKRIGQLAARLASGGVAVQPQAEPSQALFAEGQKARYEKNWADAVSKFKELAEKYPDDGLAPPALIAAAQISETNLNDKKSADELRKRAFALQEKRAAGDPMELYKLAGLSADAGDLEKAVATYRKFLASEDAKIPANIRVLAQFRVGGLLEKQDKKAEAIEAYKAVAAIAASDDYSNRIKEQAKKRLDALAAGK